MKPSNVTFAVLGTVVVAAAIAAMIITGVMATRDENRAADTTEPTPDTGPAQTPVSDTAAVEVGDNYLDPDEITVTTGTEVSFVWTGENPHRLVGTTPGDFETGEMTEGEYTFTFDEPGTFDIHCTVHGAPVMQTTITVVSD